MTRRAARWWIIALAVGTVVFLIDDIQLWRARGEAAPVSRTFFWANVQGASHTGRASAIARMRLIVRIIATRHADAGVFSEFEGVQRREFLRLTGGTFGLVYPGTDSRNSIFYRRSAYQLIWKSSLRVPYFNGHLWRIPIARLRDRATGKSIRVIAVHNTASTHRFPHQGRWRAEDVRREVRYINGHPRAHILIAGDWNAKRPGIVAHTRLHRAGNIARIDAAFTIPAIRFGSYHRIYTRATDHRYVYTATIRWRAS